MECGTKQTQQQQPVWKHDNHPEAAFSLDFFNQELNYIHQNPVRAGWVGLPEDYSIAAPKP
jgi:hypothetical protein